MAVMAVTAAQAAPGLIVARIAQRAMALMAAEVETAAMVAREERGEMVAVGGTVVLSPSTIPSTK
jgi:hypothetical protein